MILEVEYDLACVFVYGEEFRSDGRFVVKFGGEEEDGGEFEGGLVESGKEVEEVEKEAVVVVGLGEFCFDEFDGGFLIEVVVVVLGVLIVGE